MAEYKLNKEQTEQIAKWFEHFVIKDEVFCSYVDSAGESQSWLPECLKPAIAEAMADDIDGWKDCEPTREESLAVALSWLDEEWTWL